MSTALQLIFDDALDIVDRFERHCSDKSDEELAKRNTDRLWPVRYIYPLEDLDVFEKRRGPGKTSIEHVAFQWGDNWSARFSTEKNFS